MITTRRLACLTALLALSSGCSRGQDPAAGATVRDSAGIEIVESSAPATGQPWRLRPEPSLDIADEKLFRVHATVRLPSGRIGVANQGSLELRIYEADGQLLIAAGGEGEGPGEIQRMGGLTRLGGGLLLFDPVLHRLTEYGQDGELLGYVQLDDASIMHRLVGVLDSLLLFEPGGWRPDLQGKGVYWHTEPNRAYTRDGQPIGDFAAPSGMHFSIKNQQVDVPLFGRRSAAAVGEWFYLGHAERYEIEAYDTMGELRWLIRKRIEPVPVGAEDIAELVEAALARIDDDEQRRRATERTDQADALETKPAYLDLLVGADGNLWVNEWRLPGEEEQRWSVFGEDGVWLATLTLPRRFRLMDAGRDYVLGVWRDELDVEHVRVYELIRS